SVPLLVARGQLLMAEKYRERLKGQAVPELEDILKDADLAIALTEKDPATPDAVKGAAFGLAGLVRKAIALRSGTARQAVVQLMRTSVDQLRRALELAPRDAGRVYWRIELATQLGVLLYDPTLPADTWDRHR